MNRETESFNGILCRLMSKSTNTINTRLVYSPTLIEIETKIKVLLGGLRGSQVALPE